MLTVYGVYRNTDMTEGRGHMVLDKLFVHKDDAVLYMNSRPGVMDVRREWSEMTYGDWQLEELSVAESASEVEGLEELKRKQLRQSALAKLTPEEITALGLSK